ncbi:hypothetical protein DVH24_030009 [Malus domestica]|uniref:Uncharacterized protein n=1 Tax=Malus domestica TaxID=3750 RepID=A0A498HUL7_MALDO|nr:hypothetical protein DVH24_030009 [Malus domestica]
MKYSTAEARFDLKKKLEIFADGKELDVVKTWTRLLELPASKDMAYKILEGSLHGSWLLKLPLMRDARVFLLVNFDGAMMNIRSSPRFSIYDNGEGDEWEVNIS